jgi:hypothetical protein
MKGEGAGASGELGISIKGAEGGEDVFGVGVSAGAGVEVIKISGTFGEALSVAGLTERGADIEVRGVDTETSEVSSERKEMVASDQLIDGLKRWSHEYPRTKSHGESRRVT